MTCRPASETRGQSERSRYCSGRPWCREEEEEESIALTESQPAGGKEGTMHNVFAKAELECKSVAEQQYWDKIAPLTEE